MNTLENDFNVLLNNNNEYIVECSYYYLGNYIIPYLKVFVIVFWV